MPARDRTPFFLGAVAAALYFSEGLPYGIVRYFIPTYLRFHHVDLTSIGLLSFISLPWTLKFLWSPLVDLIGSYRIWIAGAVAIIAAALGAMAVVPIGLVFYALTGVIAIASATQDIAVDAFTIRATPPQWIGPVNSIRVTFYRIALTAPGGLAIIAGTAGWPRAFVVAAAVTAGILLVVTLSRAGGDASAGAAHSETNFLAALAHWLTRPRATTLLAIVFLYRIGELSIVAMIQPYWVDRGYSPGEIGTITSVIGVIVSIVGAIAGGAIVARFGLYRSLIVLGMAQCGSNLGYALVATTAAGRWAIYAAAIVENLGYGLGTAAFLAFLMSICDRERAATEYALLSAAFNLTGTIMAGSSGAIAQHFGYPAFFWLTVLLGIPALLLIPRVRSEIVT